LIVFLYNQVNMVLKDMNKIDVHTISKSYQNEKGNELPVLRNLSFTVAPCDFVVILGESGCGKTTLLNCIAGIVQPDTGYIAVDNNRVTSQHPSRSMIFQTPCLLPWLTVEKNIAFGCRLRKELASLDKLVDKYINLMGLSEYRHLYPDALSAGMAQRVAIARSLIGLPDVLLLDEPFAALDYQNRFRLQQELVHLWQRLQQTVVFVTHDLDEALLLGRKILILGKQSGGVEYTTDIKMPYPRTPGHHRLQQIKLDLQEKMKEII
jgi:NitT/TauT family transport system ATP-binding protein